MGAGKSSSACVDDSALEVDLPATPRLEYSSSDIKEEPGADELVKQMESAKRQTADHVYRRLTGSIWQSAMGFHHGIVINAPATYEGDDAITVIEMTSNHGIQTSSLRTFLNGDSCRLVYYSASLWNVSR